MTSFFEDMMERQPGKCPIIPESAGKALERNMGLKPGTVDVNAINDILVDMSLPEQWSNVRDLYTHTKVPGYERAINVVISQGPVYPVFNAVVESTSQQSWARESGHPLLREVIIPSENCHMIEAPGFVFVELMTPSPPERKEVGTEIIRISYVGFCVQISNFQK